MALYHSAFARVEEEVEVEEEEDVFVRSTGIERGGGSGGKSVL
jgi:hypothetical protein